MADYLLPEPQYHGLPPLSKRKKNYTIMVCASQEWLGNGKGWIQINNTYGWGYSIKGFAINAAQAYLTRFSGYNTNVKPSDVAVCVVEPSTQEIVWASWMEKNNE